MFKKNEHEMLDFWEKDFDQSISKHLNFLKENLENQNKYSSKFSEILQDLDIFQNEDETESNEENQANDQNSNSNEDQEYENKPQGFGPRYNIVLLSRSTKHQACVYTIAEISRNHKLAKPGILFIDIQNNYSVPLPERLSRNSNYSSLDNDRFFPWGV